MSANRQWQLILDKWEEKDLNHNVLHFSLDIQDKMLSFDIEIEKNKSY